MRNHRLKMHLILSYRFFFFFFTSLRLIFVMQRFNVDYITKPLSTGRPAMSI